MFLNLFLVNTTDEAAEELNKILLLMLGCAVQVSNNKIIKMMFCFALRKVNVLWNTTVGGFSYKNGVQ